jgi:hypothetical protein
MYTSYSSPVGEFESTNRCPLTCTATILHGGVCVLQSAVHNKTDVGPCSLVTSVVSVFHVQTVSFSSQ